MNTLQEQPLVENTSVNLGLHLSDEASTGIGVKANAAGHEQSTIHLGQVASLGHVQTHETIANIPSVSGESSHEVDIKKLSGNLLGDFYQTFRLSQGEVAIQPPLFMLLAQAYRTTEDMAKLDEALTIAGSKVKRLRPPRLHAVTSRNDQQELSGSFPDMWGEYTKALHGEEVSVRTGVFMLEDMLARDIYYQDSRTPRHREVGDKHESIIREYILGNKMAGSPQLLQVRDSLRTVLSEGSSDLSGAVGRYLALLTETWDNNHPGLHFNEVEKVDA